MQNWSFAIPVKNCISSSSSSSRLNTNTTQTVTTKFDRVRLPLPSRMCEVGKAQHSNDLYVTCSIMSFFFEYKWTFTFKKSSIHSFFQYNLLVKAVKNTTFEIWNCHVVSVVLLIITKINIHIQWGVHNIERKRQPPKDPNKHNLNSCEKISHKWSLLINHLIPYSFQSWYKNNTSLLAFEIFNSR